MYYTSFAAAIIFATLGFSQAVPRSSFDHPTRFLVGNLLLTQELLRVPWAIGVYWTLTYEVVFYIVCSVLFVTGTLQRAKVWMWVSIAGFLAVNLVAVLITHHTLSAGRLGLIVIALYGGLIYRYAIEEESVLQVIAAGCALAATLTIVFWRHYIVTPMNHQGKQIETSQAALSSWFLGVATFFALFIFRRFEMPHALLWVGRISYSIYLVHGFVVVLLPASVPAPSGMGALFTITVIASSFSFSVIERRGVLLQQRFQAHRNSQG